MSVTLRNSKMIYEVHKEKIIQYTSKELLSLPISKVVKNSENVSIQIKLESEENFKQKRLAQNVIFDLKRPLSWMVRVLAHQVFFMERGKNFYAKKDVIYALSVLL